MKRHLLCYILASLGLHAHAQVTSENNDRLRERLKQYPAADTSKDGVLTMEEGMAFLKKEVSKDGN
jgi:hypothetical protein